jgi:hypothetical protein
MKRAAEEMTADERERFEEEIIQGRRDDDPVVTPASESDQLDSLKTPPRPTRSVPVNPD